MIDLTEDQEVPQVLKDWLNETDFRWLDEIVVDTLPSGAFGRRHADVIVRLDAIYKKACLEFPELDLSWAVVDSLLARVPDGQLVYFTPYDGALSSAWGGPLEEVVAAAALGRAGRVDALVVAAELLTTGLCGVFNGDGRTVEESCEFLISIACHTGASGGLRFEDIPNKGRRSRTNHRLAWLTNAKLPLAERRQAMKALDLDELELLLVARAVGVEELPVAEDQLLAIKASLALLEQRFVENDVSPSSSESFIECDDLWDWYDSEGASVHSTVLISAHVAPLLEAAAAVPADVTDAVAELRRDHPWAHWWSLYYNWYYSDCWPPGSLPNQIQSRLYGGKIACGWPCSYCSTHVGNADQSRGRRHFEFIGPDLSRGVANAAKFWEVWAEGSTLYTRFGKIGARGQTTLKDFPTSAAADAAKEKAIAEKLKKGYSEKQVD